LGLNVSTLTKREVFQNFEEGTFILNIDELRPGWISFDFGDLLKFADCGVQFMSKTDMIVMITSNRYPWEIFEKEYEKDEEGLPRRFIIIFDFKNEE